METFVLQTLLRWPREPLFNYLADIENNGVWQSQVIDSQWVSKTSQRADSVFEEVWSIGAEEVAIRFHESLFWPLARRAFVTHSNGLHVDIIYHFVEQGQDTLFKMEVRAGRNAADRMFVEWLRMTCEKNLHLLKAIIDKDNKIVEVGQTETAAMLAN